VTFVIRPARAEDVPLIAPWTRATFAWGDYVPDALPGWLEDEGSLVMVCVYEDDIPVAVSRAQLLSPTEAWLSGARVHPDHRRSGMGMAMNDHGVAWARDRNALVARLATEEENQAARSQVLKAGYRLTSRWVFASATAPTGRRLRPADRMRPTSSAEADAAWIYWSQSDLAQAGRDLISDGWRWRNASRRDLEKALSEHSFYQSPGGWVIAEPDDEVIAVRWVATSPSDAPLLIQGLRDLLLEQKKERVEVMLPDTAWGIETLHREGFEVHPVLIYAKGL
jgi:GNAT superfamily N-acetyltransferase